MWEHFTILQRPQCLLPVFPQSCVYVFLYQLLLSQTVLCIKPIEWIQRRDQHHKSFGAFTGSSINQSLNLFSKALFIH